MNRQINCILWQILDELNEECVMYSISHNQSAFAEADATRREVRELLDLPSEGILADIAKRYPPEFLSEL